MDKFKEIKEKINNILTAEIKITKSGIFYGLIFVFVMLWAGNAFRYGAQQENKQRENVYVLEYENKIYLVNINGGIILHGEKE